MINRLLWISTALLIPFCTHAQIIETHHIADIADQVDSQTWVLVDFDNTLFQARQALGHAGWFYDEIEQGVQQGLSVEESISQAYVHWVRVQAVCEVDPLEEDFTPLLKQFQSQGIVVLGLTLRQPMVADATIRQVASLGIDFSQTSPCKESDFVIPAKSPALYKQGAIFASDYNTKSGVLETFFSMTGHLPKKILFIDDKKKNVEDLETLSNKLGIEFTGVYYTAIDTQKPRYDRDLAAFQYKMLGKILSNEAALQLMEHELE